MPPDFDLSTDAGRVTTSTDRHPSCLNVQLCLEDDEHLVCRAAAGELEAIYAVYDRGAELVIDGDAPDLGTLYAATILPGHAKTCLVRGVVRLGAPPAEPLTCDADGIGLNPPLIFRSTDLAGSVTAERRKTLRQMGLLRD